MPPIYGMSSFGNSDNGVSDRSFYALDAQAGRPALFIAARGVSVESVRAVAAALVPLGADVVVLGDDDLVRALMAIGGGGARLVDCGSCLSKLPIVADGALAVLVTDRGLRVATRFDGVGAPPAACVAASLAALAVETARDVVLPAPVLMLPHLLPRDLCRSLIARFAQGASRDGEVASIDADGRPQGRLDRDKKRRRDLLIPDGDPLHAQLHDLLLARCAPEIARAFGARVAYTDRILVGRYDARDGWFRRHRDNSAENVAFREFAVSVNLNAEEFDGGHLLFPEYNDHRYSPPTGGALIFSGAVLHEATEVTRGCRYVLLTFFHGEASEMRRRAYVRQGLRPGGGSAPRPDESPLSDC